MALCGDFACQHELEVENLRGRTDCHLTSGMALVSIWTLSRKHRSLQVPLEREELEQVRGGGVGQHWSAPSSSWKQSCKNQWVLMVHTVTCLPPKQVGVNLIPEPCFKKK